MRNMTRKVVFTLIICGAVISLMLTQPVISLLGIQSVTERWYFIPGHYLALFFVALGIGLRLVWPAAKKTEAQPAADVTLLQKILCTVLFLIAMPFLVGVMRYMWSDSVRDISLYLAETLFVWIGLLLTIVFVSVWRKKSKAAPDAAAAKPGGAPKQ